MKETWSENTPFAGIPKSTNHNKKDIQDLFDEVIHSSEVFNTLDSKVKVVDSQVEGDATQVGSIKYYNKLLNSTPEELVKDYNLGLK